MRRGIFRTRPRFFATIFKASADFSRYFARILLNLTRKSDTRARNTQNLARILKLLAKIFEFLAGRWEILARNFSPLARNSLAL
jgi:hypothetical protein